MCSRHYSAAQRRGEITPRGVEERFWSKVDIRGAQECWLWTAGTMADAYGKFHYRGRYTGAHRVAYELTHGTIPAGLVIDHVKARGCTSTLCVNPAHLEPVPMRVNTERGNLAAVTAARHREITVCPRGHEYTAENTYLDRRNIRHCRACKKERGAVRVPCPTCGREYAKTNMSAHRRRMHSENKG